jgi:hypothetical protein
MLRATTVRSARANRTAVSCRSRSASRADAFRLAEVQHLGGPLTFAPGPDHGRRVRHTDDVHRARRDGDQRDRARTEAVAGLLAALPPAVPEEQHLVAAPFRLLRPDAAGVDQDRPSAAPGLDFH